MLRLRALAPVLLGGCQLVFGLPGREPTDAPADGATDPITACSQLSTLATDFTDGSIHPWANRFSTRLQVMDQQLATTVNNNQAVAFTEPYFDLRDSSIQLVSTRLPAIDLAEAGLELQLVPGTNPDVDAIKLRATGTQLTAMTIKGSGESPLRTITLDPLRPVWRISEAGGTVRFEVGDGDTFDEVLPVDLDVTFVRPILSARTEGTTDITTTFDDINRGMATGPTCSVAALADDFTAPALEPQRWGRSAFNGCAPVMNNGVALTPQNLGGPWSCQLLATTEYDLHDHQLELELDVSNYTPNFTLELQLLTHTNQRAGFRVINGTLTSFVNTVAPNSPDGPGAGTELVSRTFDPNVHRRLRFRAKRDQLGERLVLETSDGSETISFLGSGDLVGLDRSTLGLVTSGNTSTSAVVTVRRVTVTPF